VRTVIAEDSVLFREGLARLLADAGHQIVAAVGDAEALTAAVHKTRPDLAVVDIHMPPHRGADGANAARDLRADHPDLGIMLLSQHIETRATLDLIASGGFGYLLKDRVLDVDDFLDAARRVAGGGSALDPAVVAQLVGRRRVDDPLADLTAREREVLELMAEGLSNHGIAARLVVTERAVEKHVTNIFAKLGLAATPADHRRVRAVLTLLQS